MLKLVLCQSDSGAWSLVGCDESGACRRNRTCQEEAVRSIRSMTRGKEPLSSGTSPAIILAPSPITSIDQFQMDRVLAGKRSKGIDMSQALDGWLVYAGRLQFGQELLIDVGVGLRCATT